MSRLPRYTRLSRGGAIAKKKRKPSEFARIYHSRERVRWVKSLPCIVCGQGPCDNAHTENGGMGRKADYQTIVPLCCMPADDPNSPGYSRGHHGVLHQMGAASFESVYSLSLADHAALTEAVWQSIVRGAA